MSLGAVTYTKSTHLAEWYAWSAMKARCSNERHANYANYGGRGIRVCDRWQRSFQRFMGDMGPRPSADHSIDRRENGQGYSCGHCDECTRLGATANCRWATRIEQARNRRTNVLVEHAGRTLTIAEWAEETGIPVNALKLRFQQGWAPERALTEPVTKNALHECHGQRLTLKQWSERRGIKLTTLVMRLARGWSLERALETPAKCA